MSLQMFTDDCEFVIAESVEDVGAILEELNCDYFKPENWEPMAMDRDFDYTDDGGITRRHTVAEWIALVGRGYFAAEM